MKKWLWCESSEDFSTIKPYKVVMDDTVLVDKTVD